MEIVTMEFEDLVLRVRAEFLEMPGLMLTFPQAERLWGLEQDLCRQVISALIGSEFLRCTREGMIARVDS
jgi:hypothetical protein